VLGYTYTHIISLVGFAENMARKPGAKLRHAGSVAKRAAVVALVESGKSYRHIARIQRCSIGFISNAVRRKSETNVHTDRSRSGRPSIVPPELARRTIRILRSKRKGSLRKTAAKLRDERTPLSVRTIRRIAKRRTHRYYKAREKPKLTVRHRKMRLDWCTADLVNCEAEWYRRVFTDEKYFIESDGAIGVWRRPEEPRPIREKSKGLFD
jgi:transposase